MMAIPSSTPFSQKGVVITVPVLVLSVSAAAIFLFFLLSSLSSCSCPPSSLPSPPSLQSFPQDGGLKGSSIERISTTHDDIDWVKDQIQQNGLHMQDNVLRKGINPRTREQQLQDLVRLVATVRVF